MKDKLVIIGANDFQNQLILKAKELGYETHVFAWKDGAVGELTADYFYPISIIEKENILEVCKRIKPKGILSVASDLAVPTVSYIAEKLNLICNDFNSVLGCTNKYEMRRKLKLGGIPTPAFIKVGINTDNYNIDDMKFPIIVKPTDRSGSRGITKVNCREELTKAIKYSIINSFENNAIIEEYIEGNEYSCECISMNGKHKFLAFTKKYTTGSPHYIEIGHIQPSDIPVQFHENIKNVIFSALDSLEIKNGASHTEFKINKDGVIGIIEIGARMGGDCIGSDLVNISTGYDFLKMVIDVAVNNEVEFIQTCKPRYAAVKFLFNEKDIFDLEQIKKQNPDIIYRISEISKTNINKVVDSSTRLGYYIIASDKNDLTKYF